MSSLTVTDVLWASRILNLGEAASRAEIKSAYRKLAKEKHPDRKGEEELMQDANRAYHILLAYVENLQFSLSEENIRIQDDPGMSLEERYRRKWVWND